MASLVRKKGLNTFIISWLILALTLTLGPWLMLRPQPAKAGTTTVYADASDGWIEYKNGLYNNLSSTATLLYTGTYASAPDYWWERSYVKFSLSGISEPVTSARIYFYVAAGDIWSGGTSPQNIIVDHIPDYATLDSSDWNTTPYVSNIGTIMAKTDTTEGWKSLDVTSYVENDRLNKRAFSTFRLRGDIENTDTTNFREIDFKSADNATNKPYVEITTTPAPPLPTTVYHLHNEASTINTSAKKMLTADPDVGSISIISSQKINSTGDRTVTDFETQSGDPNSNWTIPAGSTWTFSLWMKRDGTTGTAFPHVHVYLNSAAGTLCLEAQSSSVLTNTLTKYTFTGTNTSAITMTGLDRFFVQVYANVTVKGGAQDYAYLGIEGTAYDSTDSIIQTPSKWSYNTGAAALGIPAVDPSAGTAICASSNKLYGINATDGTQKWSPVTLGGAMQSRAPLGDINGTGTILAACQDGALYARNASTGASLWSKTGLGDALQGGVAAQFNVTIDSQTKDIAIVGTYNTSTTNNKVYFLDLENNGAILKTYQPGNMDVISSVPAVDETNNLVYITSKSNSSTQPSLWAIHTSGASAGTLKWSKPLGDISSSPVTDDGGYVIVGTNEGKLYCYDSSGTTRGSYETASSAVQGFPWPQGDKIYVSTASHGVKCFTYDPGAGTMTPTSGFNPPAISSPSYPLCWSNKLYVGSSDGYLYFLNSSNGSLSQKVYFGSTAGSPTYDTSKKCVYVGLVSGEVKALYSP